MAYIPWWQRMSPPTFAERFDLGGLAGRVGFKDGPILKGESLKIHLNKFVADFKNKNNGKMPTIMQIHDGAQASTKSIKTYLSEGKDFTITSRAEAAKKGGETTGALTKGDITTVSDALKTKINNAKARGLYVELYTTKAGTKYIVLSVTDPDLKGKGLLPDNKTKMSLPATDKNFNKITKEIKKIKSNKTYKKVIDVKPYKSSEAKLAEKKGKYYQLKEGDPHHVQKKLAKEVSEKGKREIHHSRFKSDPQTLNVMMLVDTQINNLTNLKDAEAIRNKLQTEHKRILRSNQSIEVKQRNLMMVNAKLAKLKNSLRGTKAAGLLDVKIITMDDKGNINTKFKGADTSKGILFGTKEGKKDLTKIKKGEPTKLVKLAASSIGKGGGIGDAPIKQIMLPMMLDPSKVSKLNKGSPVLSGVDNYILNRYK